MNVLQPPAGIMYPAPPWAMIGHAWAGLFRVDRPVVPSPGLHALLGKRLLGVMLVRYGEGTLRYDELAVVQPVYDRRRVGLFVHDIWVNSLASLAGGRAIWRLPKQLATFKWSGNTVRIADAAGQIATIELHLSRLALPPLPATLFGVGLGLSGPRFFPICLWACLSASRMRLVEWAAPTAYHMPKWPLISLAAHPFRASFLAPVE